MRTQVQVIFTLNLPFIVKKKEKYFISCCPPLDIWSQGETKQKAEENLKEALYLFLTNCFERGTLEKVLKDCGFVPQKRPLSKISRSSSRKEMEIPLPFIIDEKLSRCQG